MIDKLKQQLRKHEGLRLKPYRCTAGKLTIGYGRNIESNGISKQEAEIMLDNDIQICLQDMQTLFANFDNLPIDIQVVILNMRYNMGSTGIRAFKNMITAIEKQDWKNMAKNMKNSKWYEQVGNRAKELVSIVENIV